MIDLKYSFIMTPKVTKCHLGVKFVILRRKIIGGFWWGGGD